MSTRRRRRRRVLIARRVHSRQSRGEHPPWRHRLTRSAVAPYILILLLAVLLYSQTLFHELVWDDPLLLPSHPLLREPWNLPALFTSTYWPNAESVGYRPFTIWTFALNYGLNDLIGRLPFDPVGFHVVNVLLHAAVGWILFRFLASLDLAYWLRLAAALLFVAHPIHTEAGAAIVGRAEILTALFGLLFLSWHRQRRYLLLPVVVLLLTLWSKESGIAFLGIAVLVDMLYRHAPGHTLPTGRTNGRSPQHPRWPLWHYAAYGAAVGVWLLQRTVTIAGRTASFPLLDNPLVDASLLERVLTAARVQLDYLRLQLLPVGLSSDYSYNQIPAISTPTDPRVVGFAMVLVVAFVLAWRLWRTQPVIALGVLGYAVLFAPTSNFVLVIGTVMGERLAYSPSLLFCLLLGYSLWQLERWRTRWGLAALAVLVASYGALTVARNRTWATPLVFQQTQIATAPNSARAYGALGTILAETGDHAAAKPLYERALAILPTYAKAHAAMGDAHMALGDHAAAIASYEQTIALLPTYDPAHLNLGNALQRVGAAPEQVIASYRQALALGSQTRSYQPAHINLAYFLLQLGRVEEARSLVEQLAAFDPAHPVLPALRTALEQTTAPVITGVAGLNEGVQAYATGDYRAAIPALEQALTSSDISGAARRTVLMLLANAYQALGDQDQAAAYRREAGTLSGTGGPTPQPGVR